MKVSTDVIHRVWNDDEGVFLEIGPDADGHAIEIRTGNDKKSQEWFGKFNVTLHGKDFAEAVGEAILEASIKFTTR